ncbi:MAG: serine hydrolase [Bacteroidota bacterium]
MKKIITLLFLLSVLNVSAQTLYFPPLSGSQWDTIAPSSLGWCQPNIDSLYSFLESRNTDGFIVLKDGKIVLEKYFGTFTKNTSHAWHSAAKSLTALLTGVAQEKGFLQISNPAWQYLGNGWTSAPANKEGFITVKDLLQMTSGLDELPNFPCTTNDSSTVCLQYMVDAGTRWAYHTGAYKWLHEVVSNASGTSWSSFINTNLFNKTGMQGIWLSGTLYSTVRSAARFGLLGLNKFVWSADTVLKDTAYLRAMLSTSQAYNLSYGYLWWLNGKNSYMLPLDQTVNTGTLLTTAPPDMFCALGANDQKIYIVPSLNMVVVRMGGAAYSTVNASSKFDTELWGKIDSLDFNCNSTGFQHTVNSNYHISVYPNPVNDYITVEGIDNGSVVNIYDVTGRLIYTSSSTSKMDRIDLSPYAKGLYVIKIRNSSDTFMIKIVKL